MIAYISTVGYFAFWVVFVLVFCLVWLISSIVPRLVLRVLIGLNVFFSREVVRASERYTKKLMDDATDR